MSTITKTIDVTREDIANGQIGNCARCPIALAGKRAFPDAVDVLASPGNIAVFDPVKYGEGTGWIEGSTTQEADDFMSAFDGGSKVEPFSFTVTFETE